MFVFRNCKTLINAFGRRMIWFDTWKVVGFKHHCCQWGSEAFETSQHAVLEGGLVGAECCGLLRGVRGGVPHVKSILFNSTDSLFVFAYQCILFPPFEVFGIQLTFIFAFIFPFKCHSAH